MQRVSGVQGVLHVSFWHASRGQYVVCCVFSWSCTLSTSCLRIASRVELRCLPHSAAAAPKSQCRTRMELLHRKVDQDGLQEKSMRDNLGVFYTKDHYTTKEGTVVCLVLYGGTRMMLEEAAYYVM